MKEEKGWIDFVATVRDLGKITIPEAVRKAVKLNIGDIVRVRIQRVDTEGQLPRPSGRDMEE